MADLERQLSHRTDELAKAREQQTATALVNFRLQNELRAIGDRQKKPAPKSCAPSPTLRDVPNTH